MNFISKSEASRGNGPTVSDLFWCFQGIALRAFGGVLPWARRELVEVRGWLSDEEFTELLGLCQFLPGPNIGNLCVAVGRKFHGIKGAMAASLGLFSLPLVIVMGLGHLYRLYGRLPATEGFLRGLAAVAGGLILAMALKMATPLWQQRNYRGLFMMALVFLMIALARWPLAWVLMGLAVVNFVWIGRLPAPRELGGGRHD